jgi:hypothetical protein
MKLFSRLFVAAIVLLVPPSIFAAETGSQHANCVLWVPGSTIPCYCSSGRCSVIYTVTFGFWVCGRVDGQKPCPEHICHNDPMYDKCGYNAPCVGDSDALDVILFIESIPACAITCTACLAALAAISTGAGAPVGGVLAGASCISCLACRADISSTEFCDLYDCVPKFVQKAYSPGNCWWNDNNCNPPPNPKF